MSLPYAEPLVLREPGERQIPEPPRRGEPGGEPCGICARQDDLRGLVGRELDTAPAGRRQPAGRGLAREPRARRLVLRPARTSSPPTSAASRPASSGQCCPSVTWAASTSTAGATGARTSTSGSSRGRSVWSRRPG